MPNTSVPSDKQPEEKSTTSVSQATADPFEEKLKNISIEERIKAKLEKSQETLTLLEAAKNSIESQSKPKKKKEASTKDWFKTATQNDISTFKAVDTPSEPAEKIPSQTAVTSIPTPINN